VAAERLARFADVFCEPGVFTVPETRRLMEAARHHGMALKLHADELHFGGAAALAASSTVATLLPATMLFLGTGRQAPARAMIDAGAAITVATDLNPGTSPLQSFPLVLTLAVSPLRLSASEAWIAATVNGAAALGLAGATGQLREGFRADIAVHAADDFRALPYWFGERLCRVAWAGGRACHPSL
jgi:imidazolonepropionase